MIGIVQFLGAVYVGCISILLLAVGLCLAGSHIHDRRLSKKGKNFAQHIEELLNDFD